MAAELRSSAAALVLLRRLIMLLLAFFDGVAPAVLSARSYGGQTAFFPAGGVVSGLKLLSLLLLSVGLVLGSVVDSSLSSFAESGVVRFVLLLFCERAGDLVIPDVGLLFRIADLLGNGGSCFRSSAFGPVAADLLSPSFPVVPTADVRSASLIRSSKVLALLCKREGRTCLAPAFVSDERERR